MRTASWASSEAVRRTMSGNRGRDTKPELAVRRILHAQGLRYRVDYAPLGGVRRRADIVFTRARIAIFIDGCFWHGCPNHYVAPRLNAEFWRAKVDANRRRDGEMDELLLQEGWTVIRGWEHEPAGEFARRIAMRVEKEI